MIYTIVFALLEKIELFNETRKVTEAENKARLERERELEELVIYHFLFVLKLILKPLLICRGDSKVQKLMLKVFLNGKLNLIKKCLN